MLLLWSKSLHARFTALPAFCCCFCGVSLHAPDTVLLPWSDMACVWYFTTFVLCQYMHLIHTVLLLWSVMITWYSVAPVKWHDIHLILYRFCAVSIHTQYTSTALECHWMHILLCCFCGVSLHARDTLLLQCKWYCTSAEFHHGKMVVYCFSVNDTVLLQSFITGRWYFTASV